MQLLTLRYFQSSAGRALDATIESTEGAEKGDTVSLVGFGTFTVGARAHVQAQSRTGEELKSNG